MKTLRSALVLTLVACLLAGFCGAAPALANGHHGGHHGGHHSSFFFGLDWVFPLYPVAPGPYYYYPPPAYYYPAPPPPVVQYPAPPPVVQYPAPAPAPQAPDKSTLELYQNLRNQKAMLLEKLQIGDKGSRLAAISDLAGFSFDDGVRQALEGVLFSDTDPDLRVAAANALGQVKNPKAVPALEKARVADSSEAVRVAADQAIRNIQGK